MTHFTELMDYVARGFEVFGAAVLVVGLIWSVVAAAQAWRAAGGRRGYETLRETFGGVLLLGIEVLVAADLIRTVAVTPTLASVTVLGLIVLIRTFLSFSLEVEIDGTLRGDAVHGTARRSDREAHGGRQPTEGRHRRGIRRAPTGEQPAADLPLPTARHRRCAPEDVPIGSGDVVLHSGGPKRKSARARDLSR